MTLFLPIFVKILKLIFNKHVGLYCWICTHSSSWEENNSSTIKMKLRAIALVEIVQTYSSNLI
jgi:hypothetical protein